MVVLGIDPSYTCTGLVALTDLEGCQIPYGVTGYQKVSIPSGSLRMLRAGKALHTFIIALKIHSVIDLAILEDAAYGAPSRLTVAKLKELTGVYKFILDAHGIDWLEVSPGTAKKCITGKGNSEKWHVAQEIQRLYGITFPQDKGFDLSDATSLAVWGMEHGDTKKTSHKKASRRGAGR